MWNVYDASVGRNKTIMLFIISILSSNEQIKKKIKNGSSKALLFLNFAIVKFQMNHSTPKSTHRTCSDQRTRKNYL